MKSLTLMALVACLVLFVGCSNNSQPQPQDQGMAQPQPMQGAQPPQQPAYAPQAPQAPTGDVQVWVNLKTGVYHYPGSAHYGTTKQGQMMPESQARAAGYHPSKSGD